MRSSKFIDEMMLEANSLFRILQDKCFEIKNKLNTYWIEYQKSSEHNLKITLSNIYILVQFYPQSSEYQVACTFIENEFLGRRKQRYKFIINRYILDINDLGILGWNDNINIYTIEELAEYFLIILFEINNNNINIFKAVY